LPNLPILIQNARALQRQWGAGLQVFPPLEAALVPPLFSAPTPPGGAGAGPETPGSAAVASTVEGPQGPPGEVGAQGAPGPAGPPIDPRRLALVEAAVAQLQHNALTALAIAHGGGGV